MFEVWFRHHDEWDLMTFDSEDEANVFARQKWAKVMRR